MQSTPEPDDDTLQAACARGDTHGVLHFTLGFSGSAMGLQTPSGSAPNASVAAAERRRRFAAKSAA